MEETDGVRSGAGGTWEVAGEVKGKPSRRGTGCVEPLGHLTLPCALGSGEATEGE